jgi:hypothetical protein
MRTRENHNWLSGPLERTGARWVTAMLCVSQLSHAAVAGQEADMSQSVAEVSKSGSPSGISDSALPGIMRLGLAGVAIQGTWSAAASSGYGLTENQASGNGNHHRLAGSVAIGFTPTAGLDLSLRLDGRRDAHPSDAQGSNTSFNGEPTFTARYGRFTGNSIWSGELGVHVPGRDAPSLAFDAAVVDAKAGYAFRSGPLTLATVAGFRFDRSAQAKPNLALTRSGDRLALGLSDYNAALLGIGLAYQVNRTELLGEISADLLLGAASVSQSPMRVGAGLRHRMTDNWQIFALVESSPSARPGLASTDPLIPIEPRFSGRVGVSFLFGGSRVDAPANFAKPSPTPTEAPKVLAEDKSAAVVEKSDEPAAVAPSGQLRGLIRSFKGQGLRATVRVEPLGVESQADEDGAFSIDVPPGTYQIQIVTKGFKPQTREVRIEENGVTVLNADLRRERGSK